jgi:hypothetical protein
MEKKIECPLLIQGVLERMDCPLKWNDGKPYAVIGVNPDDTAMTRALDPDAIIVHPTKPGHFQYLYEIVAL